jgi:hypothetical protein
MVQAEKLQVQHLVRSINLILPLALGPEVYSASNKNEYQKWKEKFLGSKEWMAHKADNLTVTCEPNVQTM